MCLSNCMFHLQIIPAQPGHVETQNPEEDEEGAFPSWVKGYFYPLPPLFHPNWLSLWRKILQHANLQRDNSNMFPLYTTADFVCNIHVLQTYKWIIQSACLMVMFVRELTVLSRPAKIVKCIFRKLKVQPQVIFPLRWDCVRLLRNLNDSTVYYFVRIYTIFQTLSSFAFEKYECDRMKHVITSIYEFWQKSECERINRHLWHKGDCTMLKTLKFI